jgi:Flp pilus assembly protein TadG
MRSKAAGRRWLSLRADRGTVTAELAACLPVLVIVLAVAVTAVSAVAARIRLEDAAREAARAAARGDPAAARRLAGAAAPGAQLTLSESADAVTAFMRAAVHPLGGYLPGLSISARAVAAVEPRAGAP